MRVTFTEYETTSEIGSITGATFLFVTVWFTLEVDGISHKGRATVSVSTDQGRHRYDIIDENGEALPTGLPEAIVAYVKEAERIFRAVHGGRNCGPLERSFELKS